MRAGPGSKEYGALTVNLQALAEVELLFGVSAGAFQPPPKVESAVIRIVPREQALVSPREEQGFRVFVQTIFGMRRKQMRRVLREIGKHEAAAAESLLQRADIDPESRPETLAPARFAALYRSLTA